MARREPQLHPPPYYPHMGWPRSTVEKGTQSNESYERENPWNRTISTVLGVHRKLPQSTVKLVPWWTFRPRKKISSPPPPKSPIRRRHPPGPSAPPPRDPPPLLGFSIKHHPPPLPAASDSPFPLPEPEKNKKYPKRPPRYCQGTAKQRELWEQNGL